MKPNDPRCVGMAMKSFVFLVLVACGSGKPAPVGPGSGSGSGSAEPIVKDTRTELERRRDAGCERVAAKLTECAVADAKAERAAGRMSEKDFKLNTDPQLLKKHTEKYVEGCRIPNMSSRQVRVLEVCFKEEQECDPLVDCLTHLNDRNGK